MVKKITKYGRPTHQSLFELVAMNISAVLNDVINKLQCRDHSVNIDFARYKIDWLCALLLSVGGNLEDSLPRYLFEAQQMLSIIDKDEHNCCSSSLPVMKTGFKGDQNLTYPLNSSNT